MTNNGYVLDVKDFADGWFSSTFGTLSEVLEEAKRYLNQGHAVRISLLD